MNATLTCLALALVGVDLGYRPASNGGAEFIIQIDPATLPALRPGERLDIDVPREARELRPSHFSITLGNESLPHLLPAATSIPPAAAPVGPATPLLPAVATVPAPSSGMPPGREPVTVGPSLPGTAPKSTVAHGWPLLVPRNSAHSPSGASRFWGLAPLNSDGSAAQPDHPWLAMVLVVIALIASNVYVGWLFWDARQRFHGLIARTSSFGQPAVEA
jgi:uncharacterized RDD family membrane protein YckC